MSPDAVSPGNVCRVARVVLALSAALALAAASRAPAEPSAHPAPSRRIVLVGLDGADWRAIEPLLQQGRLPAFARLRAHGRTGTLLATPPLVSPILWTTIATGRRPEDHRVLDFMVDLPSGGQAPVPSTARRVAALWNLFSDAGRRVAIVGWWATWPAEEVNGTIVSDRIAPQLVRDGTAIEAQSISPAARASEIARQLVHPSELTREDLAEYVPTTAAEYAALRASLRAPSGLLFRDPLAHLATIVASTRSYSRIAEALASRDQPDLLLVYLEAVDSLSHRFLKDPGRGPRAVARAYTDADRLIGRLATTVSPDTWMIVVSDHGFYGADAGLREDPADLAGPATAWHRPYGIVAAAEASALAGTAFPPPRDAGTVTPLDLTPTVLQAAGLPASREMPGRAIGELLPDDAAARSIARVATLERPRPIPAVVALPDEATRERLRALGYIGANGSSLARVNLGEILFRKGDLAGAERELREVVADQPANLSALLWLAKAIAAQGRVRSALDVYVRALALPGAGEALVVAADLAVSSGLADQGGRLLAAARAHADAPALDVARAVLARSAGDAAAAERQLRSALRRDPSYRPALERLLDLLAADGRVAEAIAPLAAAAERLPESPELQALLGSALLAKGDAAAAEERFARALRLAPDGVSARVALARAQLQQGEAGQALATLGALPASAETSALRGAAHARRGEWTAAAADYESALGRAPATPELLNALAWARVKLGERKQAAQLLTRSLALKAEQPEIRKLLADIERPGS